MRLVICVLMLSGMLATPVWAQDFLGIWQGRIQPINNLRYVFNINRADNENWVATIVIDQDHGMPYRANSISIEGSRLRLSMKELGGSTYDGQLSSDGKSLTGTWTIRGQPFPLNLDRATPDTEWKEPPHKAQLITVDKNIKLEVLDWGGTGRPLVLLAGLGNTAHVLDDFASELAKNYHVYGITRRGYGASTAPPVPEFVVSKVGENSFDVRPPVANPYDADRLGDDVIKVLDVLKIVRPVLVGHSIAGEELSSVGTRHPDRIAGLVYLDAFYEYAYSDGVDYDNFYSSDHPRHVSVPPGKNRPSTPGDAIMLGMREYRNMSVPALAISVVPQITPPGMVDAAALAAFQASQKRVAARFDRIEPSLPNVHFVRIANSTHYVFETSTTDVLREMRTFLSGLPN